MYEVGRICIKTAGRDAGGEAVIVDILDDKFVLIDGNVRRKRCNIAHLEPTKKKTDLKKNASHEEVVKTFSELKLSVWETKPKKATERPRKQRKKKIAEKEEDKKEEGVKEKKTKKTSPKKK